MLERHDLALAHAFLYSSPHRVDCRIEFSTSRPPIHFSVDLLPFPAIWVEEEDGGRWSMASGAAVVRGTEPDEFIWKIQWRWDREIAAARHFGFPNELEGVARAHFRLLLRRFVRKVLARCDPRTLRLARGFRHENRFDAYQQLVADRTGRLAQVANVSPGTLVLLLALRDAESELARPMHERIVAGEQLNRILFAALEVWFDPAIQRRAFVVDPLAIAFGPAELRELVIQKRLLLRRSDAFLPLRCALTLPPLSFAIEDLPATPQDGWFLEMSHRAVCSRLNATSLEAGVSAFLSAHANQIRRWKIGTGFYAAAAGELVRLCRATGLRLDRRSSLDRVRRAHREWKRVVDGLQRLATGPEPRRDRKLKALPCPVAPEPVTLNPRVQAKPLQTAGDVIREGREMHNCVGALLGEVLAGELFLYSVHVDGRRLSVGVRGSGGRFQLVQAAARCNRSISDADHALLEEWVGTLRPVASGSDRILKP